MMGKRILIGMSGGLDSTYAAKKLTERGYDVIGALIIFSDCTDTESAKRAADELSIKLIIIDKRREFEETVIKNFTETYLQGGTPNPCTVCNRYVKMESLYKASVDLECDIFTTGHYARVQKCENGRYAIGRAADEQKDQSYMLWGMTQEQLAHFMPMLEHSVKSEIREDAKKLGLSSAQSKESQDVCFIPGGDYVKFIKDRGYDSPCGYFVDKNGAVIGKHEGILNYTVGQRRGLKTSLGYRAYVTEIDTVKNTVTLAPKEDLYTNGFSVCDLSFQAEVFKDGDEITAFVKVRYAAKPTLCTVRFEGERAYVKFAAKETKPAKGQSAVFYKDDVILFGGVIC